MTDDLAAFVRQITIESQADNLAVNESLVRRFVAYCQDARGRSPETVRNYEGLLMMYVRFLGGTHVLEAAREQMEAFSMRPRLRRGRGHTGAPAGRKRDIAILRSFYRWAWEEGLSSEFLANGLHGPTVRARNPRPIPDQTWLTLWHRHTEPADRVLLGLGFYLGLRVSELAALSPTQVTMTRIRDFIRKGGGEHTVELESVLDIYERRMPHIAGKGALTEALEALQSERTDRRFLLPYQGNGNRITKRFARLCQLAGVGHYTAHQMRHSAATNLLRAGVPIHLVMRILNHSNIQITMGYAAAGGTELREWLDGQL